MIINYDELTINSDEITNQRHEFKNNAYYIYADRIDIRPKIENQKYIIKEYRNVKVFIGMYKDNYPIYLILKKQRYVCTETKKSITSQVSFIDKSNNIANFVKDNIVASKGKKSYVQITKENNTSVNTVSRIIKRYKNK